jgi:selenophosphate synthase
VEQGIEKGVTTDVTNIGIMGVTTEIATGV